LHFPKNFFAAQVLRWLFLAAVLSCFGCATTPAHRPSVANIQKVLLVGFPGQVYDEQSKAWQVLNLAETKLAAASHFQVQVDNRDPGDLVSRGRRGEACLTFKVEDRQESAMVDKATIIALAQEKQVDAVMIGALKLSGAGDQGDRLALSPRDMDHTARRMLKDSDSNVTLEAILVAADGNCRWHGEMETSLGFISGIKSVAGAGLLVSRDQVAYERLDRGLVFLFMTLPKQ
jgi:hypothetical protein